MKKILFLDVFYILACKPTQTVIRHGYLMTKPKSSKTAANAHKKCNTKLSIKILDKNDIWKNIANQISDFSRTIIKVKPLILEQNIPTIQSHIQA
jgi:amidase